MTGRYEAHSLLIASDLIPPRVGNRRCTPMHADEPHRTSACIRVHRRFLTTALVPFLFYQSTRPLGRNLTSLWTWRPPSRSSEPPHTAEEMAGNGLTVRRGGQL